MAFADRVVSLSPVAYYRMNNTRPTDEPNVVAGTSGYSHALTEQHLYLSNFSASVSSTSPSGTNEFLDRADGSDLVPDETGNGSLRFNWPHENYPNMYPNGSGSQIPWGNMTSATWNSADHQALGATANGLTIAFWCYLPSFGSLDADAQGVLNTSTPLVVKGRFLYGDTGDLENTFENYDWAVHWNGNTRFTFEGSGDYNTAQVFRRMTNFSSGLLDNAVFVVCTLPNNAGTGRPEIYVNGQLSSDFGTPFFDAAPDNSDYGLILGNLYNQTSSATQIGLDGSLQSDDTQMAREGTELSHVAIFDYALTEAQVQFLYDGTVTGTWDDGFPFGNCETLVAEESYTDFTTDQKYSVFGGPEDLWGISAEEMRTLVNRDDFTFLYTVEPTAETGGAITVHSVTGTVYYNLPDGGVVSSIPAEWTGSISDIVIGTPAIVAVGPDVMHFSTDSGVSWARAKYMDGTPITGKTYLSVTYREGLSTDFPDLYIAVGRGGLIARSADGEFWEETRVPTGFGLLRGDMKPAPTFTHVEIIDIEWPASATDGIPHPQTTYCEDDPNVSGPAIVLPYGSYPNPALWILGTNGHSFFSNLPAAFYTAGTFDSPLTTFSRADQTTAYAFLGINRFYETWFNESYPIKGLYVRPHELLPYICDLDREIDEEYDWEPGYAVRYPWYERAMFSDDGRVATELVAPFDLDREVTFGDLGGGTAARARDTIDLADVVPNSYDPTPGGRVPPGFTNPDDVCPTAGAMGPDGEAVIVGLGGIVFRVNLGAAQERRLDNKTLTMDHATSITFHGLGEGQDLYDVAYADGVYVTVGAGGYMAYSDDGGQTWTQVETGINGDLHTVAMRDGMFATGGGNPSVLVGSVIGETLEGVVTDTTGFNADSPGGGRQFGEVSDTLSTFATQGDDQSGLQHLGIVQDAMWQADYPGQNAGSNVHWAETLGVNERWFPNDEVLVQAIGFIETILDRVVAQYEDSVSDTFDMSEETRYVVGLLWENALAEAFAMGELPAHAYHLSREDAIAVTAAAAMKFAFSMERLEPFSISEEAVGKAVLTGIIDETLDLDDTRRSNATLRNLIEEVTRFGISIKITDDPALYTGWAMNLRTFAVSQYTNFKFNSLASLDGVGLAAADDGLYELAGDDDEGAEIAANLKTGVLDFGTGRGKRVPEAWIGQRRDGNLVLKTTTDESVERWYVLKRVKSGLKEQKVSMHKGVKAVFWEFELHNVDGSDFELEFIKLTPLILSRRSK